MGRFKSIDLIIPSIRKKIGSSLKIECEVKNEREAIDILSLGNIRIVEKDGTIKKNATLKEIHSYWIIYEKDGSLHDFLISAIDRIELGNKKGKAIYFDKKGKATIKWIP